MNSVSRGIPLAVFARADFLDAAMCRGVRLAMDQGIPEPAEILQSGPVADRDVRQATLMEISPGVADAVEARLDAVREDIARHYGMTLTGREGAGFVRYHQGGFYRPHRDVVSDGEWSAGARRRIAVVVFLNSSCASPGMDDFSGGELVILPEERGALEDVHIVPTRGLLAAFHASALHEVHPVRAGRRDVIVDWFY